MDRVTVIIGVLAIISASCIGMAAIKKTNKERTPWIVGAVVTVAIAVGVGFFAVILPDNKSTPTIQQGECSSSSNIGGNFSPNCDNKKD